MSVRVIRPGETLGARRGDVVICVAVGGRLEAFARSLKSVLRHTDQTVPVILHGTGAPSLPGDAIERLAGADAGAQRVLGSIDGGIAAAVDAAAPADVVLFSEGCSVADGWLERLRAVAAGDGASATVSALPDRMLRLPAASGDDDLGERARRVAQAAPADHSARLDAPLDGCVYVPRAAIELAGPVEEPGFAARCSEVGLAHLLAGDVLVAVPAGNELSVAGRPTTDAADRLVGAARRAVRRLSVTIDARILSGPLNGTRVHALELIAAVARTGNASVTAIVPVALDERTRKLLGAIEGLELRTLGDGSLPSQADVVHLPHQVSSPADLAVLAGLGERLVITQQDLIGYHSPSHFVEPNAWRGYRELTRRGLAAADGVLFFSAHARSEALSEALVDPERAHVVPIGVDHGLVAAPESRRPSGLDGVADDADVILCLGTDLAHKNRPFALRILAALLERNWEGRLVLAGPHIPRGSSRDAERALLAGDSRLAARVVDLGEVADAERDWLLERAALVLCPTVREGFGLVPHEAAARGTACMWAPGTALAEYLPDEVAGMVPWDASATAERALALLRDPALRDANVEAVGAAAQTLTWARTGERLLEVYAAVCRRPPSPAAVLERETGLMRGDVSEDAMRLVGPDGLLPRDLERPLLALLSKPRLAQPLAAALKAGYRASQRRP
ncbi:MAG: glycosyltransferase [Solirubrobacteraceae bacterium]